MKKFFTLLLLVVAMGAIPLCTKAQTIVLSEGFENGIPSTWTQEYVVGDHAWAVETGGTFPSGSYQGLSRAYLRNESGQSMGYKTRLVSPVMDLSQVNQPILRFAHAQVKWTAEFDTLRVLYRTGANAEWMTLQEYVTAVPRWSYESIDLLRVNSTYQIAFEGSENMGRGIVLDSVLVRSRPECTQPHDMYVSNMANSAATLNWQASFDAESFTVKISTENFGVDTLDFIPDSLFTAIASVDGSIFSYRTDSLTPNTRYYYYVRSVCSNENSEWGKSNFRMNVYVSLPYTQDFNMPYNEGIVSREDTWTYGGNTGSFNPLINTYQNAEADLALYSNDTTRCLVFTGANNTTTAISAGRYVYAATPEISVDRLSSCQVSFWGTVAGYCRTQLYHRSLIVGVMTDPDDVISFVPVDTVSVWGRNTFEEFVVSFENYTDSGKYIAFVSNFDEPNIFYIDNVTVEQIPACAKVRDIKAAPLDTAAVFTWPATAASYNIIVADSCVNNPAELALADIIVNTQSTTNGYTVTGLAQETTYYIYVQGVNAATTGAWSNAMAFTTSYSTSLPMTFGFEAAEGFYTKSGYTVTYPSHIQVYSNDPEYPYRYTTNPNTGNYCMYMTMDGGCDSWAVFPMVDNVQSTQITFQHSCGTTTGNDSKSRIIVGVMTNPADINTFVPVSEFVGFPEYTRCFASFTDYTGDGHYIALRWKEPEGVVSSINYIDDVTIDSLGSCLPPATITATAITDSSAVISWTAGTAISYNVKVSTTRMTDESLNGSAATVASFTGLTATTIAIDSLDYATTYYCYIQAVCDSSTTGMWSSAYTFTTNCPDKLKLPYFNDFEKYSTGVGIPIPCWHTGNALSTSTSYIPYIYNSSTYAESGSNSLRLYGYSTTASPAWAATPALDIDNMSNVKVSFYARITTASYRILVGVMDDPEDISTFTVVDSIATSSTSVNELVTVSLRNYTGTGKHIAFRTPYGTTSAAYIDDLTIESMICGQPFDLELVNATDSSLTVTWDGITTDGWEVLLTNAAVNTDSIDYLQDATVIYSNDEITTSTVTIDGLAVQTEYYLYVRPLCGDSEWSDGALFATACAKINPRIANRETFDNYIGGTTSHPDCWTCANAQSTSATYVPYIYNSTTYAHSGSNSLRMYGYSTTYSPAWVATPEINTTDMSIVIVNFWGKPSSASYCLLVGVMDDPNDISTFTVIDSLAPGNTNLAEYSISLENYTGTGKYIGFRTPYGATSYFYIDDVSIEISTCASPKPALSRITDTSVRVASNLRIDNPWHLYLTKAEVSADSLLSSTYTIPDSIIVVDTIVAVPRAIALQNLTPNTVYYVAAATVCDTTTSKWSTESFVTMCAPKSTTDFGVESFEDYTTGAGYSPDCWTVGSLTSTSTTYIPYVYSGNARTGSKSLRFYSSTTYNGAYAIMPAIDVDSINKMQVKFYGTTASTLSTYANQLIVGVVTDPADMSTFTAVDTINTRNAKDGYLVRFDKYRGDYNDEYGKHITFLSNFAATNYFYMDDIQVDTIPTCAEPIINVDSVSVNNAWLSWQGNSDSYRLVLTSEVMESDSLPNDKILADTIVSGNTVNITGLSSATIHYAYMQSICSATDTSNWSIAVCQFTTECPVMVSLPFTDDFENSLSSGSGAHPSCWSTVYTSASSDAYPYLYTSKVYSGTKSVYFYGTTSYASAIASPTINVNNLSECLLNFKAIRYSTSTTYRYSALVGVVSDPDSIMETFTALDTISPTSATEWETFSLDLSTYDSTLIGDAKHIAFVVDGNVEGATTYFILDDVSIERIPTCFTPLNANISNVTRNAAHIAIVPYAETDTAWQLQYTLGDSTVLIDLDTTEYDITGLNHSTTYNVLVRTNCGAGDYSNWLETSFTTQMEVESINIGFELDEGWQRTTFATSDTYKLHSALESGNTVATSSSLYEPYQIVNTTTYIYSHTGDYALRLYNTATYDSAHVILPYISESVDTLQLSFDMRAAYARVNSDTIYYVYPNNNLHIGYIDPMVGVTSFEGMYTYTPSALTLGEDPTASNNYLFDHISVNIKNSPDRRLAVLMPTAATTYIYIDNMSVASKGAYTTPSIENIEGLDTTMTLNWNADDNTAWNVYVVQGAYAMVDAPDSAIVAQMQNVTDTFAVISGLTENTDYSVYLQVAGQGNDFATYSSRAAFTTACAFKSADVTYGFEESEGYYLTGTNSTYKIPDCWTVGNMASTSQTYIPYSVENTTTYDYTLSGTSAFRFYGTSSYFPAYAVMPLVDADLDTMQLEFYGRCLYGTVSTGRVYTTSYLGSTYTQSLVVGTVSNPQNMESFVPIDTVTYSYTTSDLSTTTVLANDPNGLKYFQKFTVPLANASGRYIAFIQPGAGYFYMDSVSVVPRSGCLIPKDVETLNVTDSSAMFTWKTWQDAPCVIKVATDELLTNIISQDTVIVSNYQVTALMPNTTYYWSVQQLCSETEATEWTKVESFTTECLPATVNYTQGFEITEAWHIMPGQTSDTYKVPDCWKTGNGSSTSSTYTPYSVVSTATISYAYSGNYALRLYSTSTYSPAYAVMPALEGCDMDTLQISFMGRCGYHNITTGKISGNYTTSTYAHSLIVGTVTDPDDISTFVALDTVVYSQTLTTSMSATADNNYLFENFSVSLRGAVGPYVALVSDFGQTNYFYVDDVRFETLNECDAPTALQADTVAANDAVLSWTHRNGSKWVVNIYTANDTEGITDTVTTTPIYNVSGLESSTTYFWMVKQICGEDEESPWSVSGQFTTAFALPFNEDFSTNLTVPDAWTRVSGLASDAFAGTAPTTTSTSWARYTNNYGFVSDHQKINNYGTTKKDWLITPSIVLNNTDSAQLVFDVALTDYNNANSITSDVNGTTGVDDQFMVIISDDGGASWKRENATIWNNETATVYYGKGDYVYNNIAYNGEQVIINLAKYAGKNIKVAFYAESRVTNADNDLHIDNVHINYYSTITDVVSECQYTDIEGFGFTIMGDTVSAGVYEYRRYVMSTDEVRDSIYVLEAHVLEAPTTELQVTICEGESYSENNFMARTTTGIYKQKLVSAAGCDSIVMLNLTVLPTIRVQLVDTICQGQTYTMNGVAYNRNGVYVDTLSSTVTGCDSIVTLVLTINDAFRSETNQTICTGTTYEFGGQMLSVSGTYVDTMLTATGCDSIATLHLTVAETLYDSITAYICRGDVYNENGFTNISAPGTYRLPLTSAAGCDSIVVLTLDYYDTDTTRLSFSVNTVDLPYTYESIYYPEGTEAGVYVDTIVVQGQICSAVVIHTLTIVDGSGLNQTSFYNLSIVPNIISRGEVVTVNCDFDAVDKDDVVIEVHDMLGRCIMSKTPTEYPISIQGLNVSGVYTVRIKTGSGKDMLGRVIVR